MKYLVLLLVVGLAAASGPSGPAPQLKTGQEHVFEYAGRLMTGIPALANQYSGLGINATVSLIYKTPTTFGLTVLSPKFVKVNDVLSSVEDNWRQVQLPEMVEVPAEFKTILSKPVIVHLNAETGEIIQVVISRNEPEWSVNFKKGIISLFQIKMETGVSSNMIERPNFETLPYWKVMEETVAGKCLATYQVNELPEYLVKENPTLIPSPGFCTEKKYFEIVRTLDFDNCDQQSSFSFYRPGHFMQKGSSESLNNIGSMITRSSTTRRIACGSHTTGLTVQSIISDGESDFQLIGTKAENVVSGSLQNLRLKAVKQMKAEIPQPSTPVTLDNIMFEYTQRAYGMSGHHLTSNSVSEQLSTEHLAEGRIPRSIIEDGQVLAKSIPRTFFQGLNSETTPYKAEFVTEITRLLKEVMMVIHGESSNISLTESDVNMSLLTVVRGMTTLETAEEIQRLYTILMSDLNPEQTDTMQQLFIDTIVMTGTPQSVEFFAKMVRDGKVSQSEISSFFMFLPRYIITPTQKVLKGLFKLVTEVETITKFPTTYSLAITSLSQLIQSACVAESRKTAFPLHVFGEFCTPESEIVQEVIIPYLARTLHKVPENHMEEEVRNIHIVALGLVRHKNVIPELTPIIDSQLSVSTSNEEGSRHAAARVLAVWSLMSVGYQNPHLVIPILTNVFTNPAEATEMRIAAFNALLKMNPSKVVFDTIAAQTRMEPDMDMELLKVINSGLYTLGYQIPAEVIPSLPVSMAELIEKAKLTYDMIRKTYGIVPSTASFYTTEFLKDFDSGYTAQLAWVSAHEQIMPRSGYLGLSLFLQKYYIDIFQGGFMLRGTESVFDQFSSVLAKVSGSKSTQKMKSKIKGSLKDEFSNIFQKLDIESHQSDTVQAYGFFQMAESGIIFRSFTQKTSDLITEKILDIIQNPSSFLAGFGDVKLNFQKTIDLSPMQMMFPSDMGFPVQVEVNALVTASLVGKASFELISLKPSISLTGKTLLASQYSGVVTTICPFTSEYLATGIDQQAFTNIPGTIGVEFDILTHKLAVYARPTTKSTTVVGNYRIMPYTTIGHINKLELISKTLALKQIKSISPRKTMSVIFGEMLGLGFKTQLETESCFVDTRSITEYISIYKNPINMMLFGWTSPALSEHLVPSVRFHRMTTVFEPSQSSTKELDVEFKFGIATKAMGESILKYHTVMQKSISSLSESEITEIVTNPTFGNLFSAVSPLKIFSQSISAEVHPRRQHALKEIIGQLETSALESSEILGFTLITNLILKSTRPRTYSFILAGAFGSRLDHETKLLGRFHQDWNLFLESEAPQILVKSVSIRGHVNMPILPIWNIELIRQTAVDFDFRNKIALTMFNGQTSQVTTTGTVATTEAQKKFSLKSLESQRLRELLSSNSPISLNTIAELKEIVRLQATTLDKVVFESEFINMPKIFEQTEMGFIQILKVFLWPYYTPSCSEIESIDFESGRFKTTVELTFKQGTPTFDLKIDLPTEKVFFRNVRIIYPFSLFFPLTAARNNLQLGLSKVVSGSVLSDKSCMINGNQLVRFNGKPVAIPTTMNDPFVIAADSSKYKRFMVLAEQVQPGVWKTVIVLGWSGQGISNIKVMPSGSHAEVILNGQTIHLEAGKSISHNCHKVWNNNDVAVEFCMTSDDVVIVKAPLYLLEEVRTNGHVVEVIPSIQLKNKLGGLCGNFQKAIPAETSAGHCVYSEPELEIASWTVLSESTLSTMSPAFLSQLKKETEVCSRITAEPTQVAKAYKAATGKCTLLKHVIETRPGKVCLSQVPVTQCGQSCKPKNSEMTQKAVPFTCLPQGRLAEHYLGKVDLGQELPELAIKETSFTAQVEMPAHCIHALVTADQGQSRGCDPMAHGICPSP